MPGYYDVMGLEIGDDDVLGDAYDLLGDDDMAYDILGAAKRKKKASALKKAVKAAVLAKNSAVVRASQPQASRRLMLQIDSGATLIAAGATQTITFQPVEPFRPENLLVDPVNAPSFLITQLLIGRKSQFVGTGSIAASTLSALSPLAGVEFDTAQTSQPLQLTVQNVSGAALRFLCTIIGTAVDLG